ncbi:MAG TPA: alpha/beta fold hydrolase [Acidimicrobiales bacterium]|nr:alpha/beta fold hydrolase [Acidimicrobiales bacterium]
MLVSVRGIRLNVVTAGEGRPLLFLHGSGGDVTNWDAQLSHFAATNRVIAVDERGFGRSDRTLGDITLADYAGDVAALMAKLDVWDAVVVGLSLGGMIAQELALQMPERIAGLVLADTAGGLDDEMREMLASAGRFALEEGMEPMAEAFRGALFAPATIEGNQECIDTFIAQFSTGDPLQHYLANKAVRELDTLSRIKAIDVPVLVICGEHDQICPPHLSRQIHEAIPGSELVLVPDAAHITNMEQPERFNAELERFLLALPATAPLRG